MKKTPGGFVFTKIENCVTRSRHVLNANVLLTRQIRLAREVPQFRGAGTKVGDHAL
jgi:hypothetical protein